MSPRRVQVFTPVKGFTRPGTRTRSFKRVIRRLVLLAPTLQRVSFLYHGTLCPVWEKKWLFCQVFCWKTERNRMTAGHAGGLWSRRTPAAGRHSARLWPRCKHPENQDTSHVTSNGESMRYLSLHTARWKDENCSIRRSRARKVKVNTNTACDSKGKTSVATLKYKKKIHPSYYWLLGFILIQTFISGLNWK